MLSKTTLLLSALAIAHAAGNGRLVDLARKDVSVENGGRIRIRNKVSGQSDFRLDARLEPYPLLRVAYKTRSADTVDKFKFAAGFLRVIEYTDSVTPKNSENYLRLHKDDGNWNHTITETSSDQGKVYTIRAEFKPEEEKFADTIFAIVLRATDYATTLNGTALDPSSFKYDIEITNWPFEYENSHLGILQVIRTNEKLTLKDGELMAGDFGKVKFIKTLELDDVSGGTVAIEGNSFNASATNDLSIDNDDEGNGEVNSKILFKLSGVSGKNKILWDPELTSDLSALEQTAGASTVGAGLMTLAGAFVAMFAF